jgi:TonB-linked SusC/RagA family outer membrane protein
MYTTAYQKKTSGPVLSRARSLLSRMFMIKMLMAFFLMIAIQLNARTNAQTVTLSEKSARLENVLKKIKKQSGYAFLYQDQLIRKSLPVNIEVVNASLEEALTKIFADQPLTYEIVANRLISIKAKSIRSQEQSPGPAAPKVEITGTVRGRNAEPLVGATVTIQGTSISVATDEQGRFSINADNNATLVFSFIGYQTVSRSVASLGANPVIDMVQQEDVIQDVVVVGYGTQRRARVTAAISSVPMKEVQDMPVSNVATAMQGKIPGVVIQQNSGAPGSTPAIKVRGFGSINAGNTPLIVVDGNIVSADVFAQLNSIDIESIDVLKDASSSAIYGSRGANGVLMVTTKRGKPGKTSVNLDVFAGVQTVANKMDMLNSVQFAEFGKDASNNAYLDNVPGAKITDPNSARPSSFLRYRYPRGEILPWFDFDDPAKIAAMPYNDFQDLIFRSAMMNSYQLSFSGGTDKTRYSVSGGYLSQEGILKNSDLKRYTVRANIESEILPRLKVGVNLIPTYRIRNEVQSNGHWADNGVINAALSAMPMAPIYAADGVTYSSQTELAPAYNYPGVTNPVANITEYRNKLNTANVLASTFAEYAILKSLKYRASGNVSFTSNRRDTYRTSRMPLNQILPPTVATGSTASDQSVGWLFNQTLEYNKQIGEAHNFSVLIGMESTKTSQQSSGATGSAYPNDLVETLNASANGTTTTATSSLVENSTVSYFARINYSYMDKYLLNVSVRRDGSSIFGPDNRWGSFPAVSVGWRLSEENFLKNVDQISEAKLRASYGISGNNAFSSFYPYAALLSTDNYVFNNVLANGLRASSPENRNLSWEKNQQFDIGVDLGLFNNRLYVTADYYDRVTKDLLLSVNVPTITGFSTVVQNIGKMQNRGWEFSLSSRNLTGKFTWNTSANLSWNRNEVLALGPTGDPIRSGTGVGETNITMIGQPIGSFFGYRQTGIFMNQADLDANPHDATSKPGDVKYADINGDKKINADDRGIIGNNQPDFIYGITNSFSFKGFDLNVSIQGTQGGEILNLSRRFFDNLEGNQNQMTTVLNRWRSESAPGDGKTPRANARTTGLNNAVSSRWVEDGSYLRIQNVTLAYRLPASIVKRAKLQQVRLYVSAQNLYTFTDYLGYNPEVSNYEGALTGGVDYGSFPLARTFSVGINLGF